MTNNRATNDSGHFPARPLLWFFRGLVKRSSFLKRAVVELFENVYYDSSQSTWNDTYWLGVRCNKYPTDLFIYQEIIFENRPDIIVETGTLHGGSALYLASVLDLVGHGRIVSIDVEFRKNRPQHDRITYITGSSISDTTIDQLEPLLAGSERRMVILDSDHRKGHVEDELRIYSRYVTPGQYLIVEDSAINGHPVLAKFGPGPYEAIETFLKQNKNFVVDENKERFLLSANHKGNLRCLGKSEEALGTASLVAVASD